VCTTAWEVPLRWLTSASNWAAISGSTDRRPLSMTMRSRFLAGSPRPDGPGTLATDVSTSNTSLAPTFGLSAKLRMSGWPATSASARTCAASAAASPSLADLISASA
jgi:hypothetical protein